MNLEFSFSAADFQLNLEIIVPAISSIFIWRRKWIYSFPKGLCTGSGRSELGWNSNRTLRSFSRADKCIHLLLVHIRKTKINSTYIELLEKRMNHEIYRRPVVQCICFTWVKSYSLM